MATNKLAEFGRTILNELDDVAREIEAMSIDLRSLLPEAKFWRWQIEALIPLALTATRKWSRKISRVESADAREAAREYSRALEFVEKAQETVAACDRILAKWNRKTPWAMACCEQMHEVLCEFPGIVVADSMRRYAPVRRTTQPRPAATSWFRGYL